MGKWRAVEGRDHPHCGGERFWSVSEEDGSKLIFITRDERVANQVVREHNAAPELLDACEKAAECLRLLSIDHGPIFAQYWSEVIESLSAAIAKARGEG